MASYKAPKDSSAAPKTPAPKAEQPSKRAPQTPAKDTPVFTDWAAI